MITKNSLSKNIAQKLNVPSAAVDKFIEIFLNEIINGVEKEGLVRLVGFGSFSVQERSARKGRNPGTGEEIDIPAKRVAKFSPGSEFKEALKPKKNPKKKVSSKKK